MECPTTVSVPLPNTGIRFGASLRFPHGLGCAMWPMVSPAGVEVPQSVGGLCKVLPEDQAPVVQRAPAAAACPADQRLRALPGDEGAVAAARALLHAPPGK